MVRVLIVAVACTLGALLTWLFVPTVQPAGVNEDMPVFTYNPDAEEPAPTESVAKNGMLSEEKRRVRAEQIVGQPLQYITGKKVYSTEWFSNLGSQKMERAMDECFLITDPLLYMEHNQALHDEDSGEDGDLPAVMMKQASLPQMLTCKNLFVAYFAAHGEEFKF